MDEELDAKTVFAEKRPITSRGSASKGFKSDIVLKVRTHSHALVGFLLSSTIRPILWDWPVSFITCYYRSSSKEKVSQLPRLPSMSDEPTLPTIPTIFGYQPPLLASSFFFVNVIKEPSLYLLPPVVMFSHYNKAS